MEVSVRHAKSNLSKLMQQAEKGEEVIIARNGKPAVKLVPVSARNRSRDSEYRFQRCEMVDDRTGASV